MCSKCSIDIIGPAVQLSYYKDCSHCALILNRQHESFPVQTQLNYTEAYWLHFCKTEIMCSFVEFLDSELYIVGRNMHYLQ